MTVSAGEVRATLRALRRSISEADQALASSAVARRLADWIDHAEPGTASAFVANDGELSPSVVVELLVERGWSMAYPRVDGDHLVFHLAAAPEDFTRNRWDLTEPRPHLPVVSPSELDLVLVPLVGFDRQCRRIGRGRGFYDRAFSFMRPSAGRQRPAAPMLVGIAHEVQRVDGLSTHSHDVELDAVVTPDAVYGRL